MKRLFLLFLFAQLALFYTGRAQSRYLWDKPFIQEQNLIIPQLKSNDISISTKTSSIKIYLNDSLILTLENGISLFENGKIQFQAIKLSDLSKEQLTFKCAEIFGHLLPGNYRMELIYPQKKDTLKFEFYWEEPSFNALQKVGMDSVGVVMKQEYLDPNIILQIAFENPVSNKKMATQIDGNNMVVAIPFDSLGFPIQATLILDYIAISKQNLGFSLKPKIDISEKKDLILDSLLNINPVVKLPINKQVKINGNHLFNTQLGDAQFLNSEIPTSFYSLESNNTISLFGLPIQVDAYYTNLNNLNLNPNRLSFSIDFEKLRSETLGDLKKQKESLQQYKNSLLQYLPDSKELNKIKSNLPFENQQNEILKNRRDKILDSLRTSAIDSLKNTGRDSLNSGALDSAQNFKNEELEKLNSKIDAFNKKKKRIEDALAKIEEIDSKLKQLNAADSVNSIINSKRAGLLNRKESMEDSMLNAYGISGLITKIKTFNVGVINPFWSPSTLSGAQLKGIEYGQKLGSGEITAIGGNLLKQSLSFEDTSPILLRTLGINYAKSFDLLNLKYGFIHFQNLRRNSIEQPSSNLFFVNSSLTKEKVSLEVDLALSNPTFNNEIPIREKLNSSVLLNLNLFSGISLYGNAKVIGSNFDNPALLLFRRAFHETDAGISITALRSKVKLNLGYHHLVLQLPDGKSTFSSPKAEIIFRPVRKLEFRGMFKPSTFVPVVSSDSIVRSNSLVNTYRAQVIYRNKINNTNLFIQGFYMLINSLENNSKSNSYSAQLTLDFKKMSSNFSWNYNSVTPEIMASNFQNIQVANQFRLEKMQILLSGGLGFLPDNANKYEIAGQLNFNIKSWLQGQVSYNYSYYTTLVEFIPQQNINTLRTSLIVRY